MEFKVVIIANVVRSFAIIFVCGVFWNECSASTATTAVSNVNVSSTVSC